MGPSRYNVYQGAIHVHSNCSDGSGEVREIVELAQQAKLDYLILTDHNTARARDVGWEDWHDSLLLSVGIEIGRQRTPHYLAWNLPLHIPTRLRPFECVKELKRQGAYVFAAHPIGRKRLFPMWPMPDCPTEQLEVLDGMELWSYMHDWVDGLRHRTLWRHYLNPDGQIAGPPAELLERWEQLTARRRFPVVGALDVHAARLPLTRVTIFPYLDLFRALRTHVLCEPFTGDAKSDLAKLYEALAEGRSFMSYDVVGNGDGFSFIAKANGHTAHMGEAIPYRDPIAFQAYAPRKCTMRLLHAGRQLAIARDNDHLEHSAHEPGAYRIEATINGRPWLFSNPIYIDPPPGGLYK
jgi:hypothetical protein